MTEYGFEGVLAVSELNGYVSELLAADPLLGALHVRGEISGFKRHSSGHLYFSLKDEQAVVRCVMFRSQAMQLDFRPQDGMRVVLNGYASLYTRDGAFQLYAQTLEQCGEGELYLRFLECKQRLEAAGYFDSGHKKEIPFLPRAVGVVTSGTGAAVQDILQIIGRRFPRMAVVLAPVKVQGAGAAEEIARAVRAMNEKHAADVLIVGRGGGSIEDLWAFNELVVADAIYESEIPVISAVGHETDFTIADFVADLRAPTPSAAAELAVPEWNACIERVSDCARRLRYGLTGTLTHARSRVKLLAASHGFRVPRERMDAQRQTLDRLVDGMTRVTAQRLQQERASVARLADGLAGLNPLAVLRRGYAVVRDADGNSYTDAASLSCGQRVRIVMRDGNADATIDGIVPKENETDGKNSQIG